MLKDIAEQTSNRRISSSILIAKYQEMCARQIRDNHCKWGQSVGNTIVTDIIVHSFLDDVQEDPCEYL